MCSPSNETANWSIRISLFQVRYMKCIENPAQLLRKFKLVKMDDPNITMEEYIRLEEEKAHRRGKVYNYETVTYGKIWDNEDVYDLRSVEAEFPAIVFNDTLISEATLLCEPTVSSLNNDEIDFRISFDESDDEYCTTVYTAYTNRMDMAYPNRMDTAYRLSGRYPAVTFCASIRTYSLNNTTYTVINTAYHGY
ncbi:hypothetical protein Tco_0523486 [Tanacetum coccineum]